MSIPDVLPLLEVRNLSRKTPENTDLLSGVRFQLYAGDRCVLRGPSGAGKSVLLRSLAALDPAEGEWYFQGEPVSPQELPRFRSRVLYVSQRPSFPEGRVVDALREPFAWHAHRAKDYDEGRVQRWVAGWGRGPEFLQQPTETLSGGEAGGLAVIRALLLEPTVLLLDEPTAGMDDESTARLEQVVFDWFAENDQHAYVWVAHDAAQATRVAQRVLRVHGGQLTADA